MTGSVSSLPVVVPSTTAELIDQDGGTWIRKHPEPGKVSVAVTADDLFQLGGHYSLQGLIAEDTGDYAARDRHFAEAGRLGKAGHDLNALARRLPAELIPTALIILNVDGVDQHGVEWLPRQFPGGLVAAYLTVPEIMALRKCYATAAADAVELRQPERWSSCEQRRDSLLMLAAVVDPSVVTVRHLPEPGQTVGSA